MAETTRHSERHTSPVMVLVVCLALTPLLTLPLGWREQAVFGAVVIVAAALLNRTRRSHAVTLTLMAVSAFSTLRYGYFRATQTWDGLTSAGHLYQWDTVFVLLMLGAEFYAFTTLFLGYFQMLRPLRRLPVPLQRPREQWPTVDVFIPTYNEPLGLVRATVLGALAMDYPAGKMHITVLDDGHREDFRAFAAAVGVAYLARRQHVHAKAGNINHALARTSGEFVAIFDSDHVPTRTFLQTTLGWFDRDARLGLVQTPHHFYSPDPFERNLGQFRRMPNESELFHRLIQDGNDLWNASFFCGSCAVLRRTALDAIGGIAVETVTEDAHTALRMQRRGWNTAYLNMPQAAGLATESLAAHIGQRIRWARGMVQILRLENPLFGPGLSIGQRLCYFNAAAHFLFALPRLVFLTVPLTYLLLGMVNIYGHSLAIFAYALPHIILSNMTNARVQRRHRFSFWSEIYETVLAPYVLVPTLLALVNPRLGRFNVTSKGGVVERSYFDHAIALPFLGLLALNIAGLIMAGRLWATDPAHHDTVMMNALWTFYNVVILSIAASVAWEKRQRRADARVDVSVRVTVIAPDGACLAGAGGDLSRGGCAAHLEGHVRFRDGDQIVVAFTHQGSRCDIGARVVRICGRVLHLRFDPLALPQEEFLTNLIYSRPDAWLSWHASRPIDRPWRSLLQIVLLGLRGIVVVPLGAVTLPPSLRRPKRAPAVAALTVLFGVLLPSSADAAARPPTRQARTATFEEVYDLRALGAAASVRLQGPGASQNLFFGVPLTKIITAATLRLRYISQMPSDGTLVILLNGTRVASVRFGPGNQLDEIPLPTDLLTTDNTVTLQLGNCDGCGEHHPPAIAIDAESTLAIAGAKLPLPNDLSLLPIPFLDPTGQRAWALPVVFSGRPDLASLQAAAVVASWFGVFSDVRGVRFPVRLGELPEGNALVVLRTGSDLANRLSIPKRSGSVIAVRENPRDPYGALLVVAGDDPGELMAAARALVTRRGFPPHASVVAPRDVPAPPMERRSAPRWLTTDRPAAIGMYTSPDRLRLQGSGSVNIYFRLPPDLFLRARLSVPLLLKFDYASAPQSRDLAAHIRVNDQDVDTIRLRPSASRVERAVVVRLPTGTLRSYANTLTVDFDLGRQAPTDVLPSFAIHRDSSIDLRGLPHSVVLPRLELFADSGFPFTEWPDLGRTAVVLANVPAVGDYEALLETAGFFGAQTGSPATSLTVTDVARVDTVRDKDLLLLGSPAVHPLVSAWTARLPLEMGADGPRVSGHRIASQWLHPEWPFRDADRGRLAALFAARPRPEMTVEQFVSPFRNDRSVVAIVPGEGPPYGAMAGLFRPAVRNGPVYGGVAVALGGRFQSFLVGNETYRSGDRDLRQLAVVWLFEHYRFLPAFVLLLAAIVAVDVRRATNRLAARRLSSALCVVWLCATGGILSAQTHEGVDILLSKARSLEARGRMDLAAQNWNQVLLVDPNQTEALEGLARLAKQNGDADGLRRYVERLRKIDPSDPAIAAIEKTRVLTPQDVKLLDDAGRLAAQNRPDDAMAVYRRVFGDAPPTGKWAESYYNTEAASAGGRAKAVAQLRDRVARDPANEVYRLWLARLLTYEPATRKEGLRLLESIRDPGAVEQARSVWRQALVWEKGNPDVQASLEAYTKRYPDRELQASLNEVKEESAGAKYWTAMQRGAALQANQPEAALAAFEEAVALRPGTDAALLAIAQMMQRRGNLAEAQAKFEQVLKISPTNVEAMVGLGYVRLAQKSFDAAGTLFARAQALDARRPEVAEGYRTARYWSFVQQGGAALAQDRIDPAIAAYRDALAIDGAGQDALVGLADANRRKGNRAEAVEGYRHAAAAHPTDARAWLGLIRVAIDANDPRAALDTVQAIPQPARSTLEKNGEYLARLAQVLYGANQPADADRALRAALDGAAQSDSDAALAARLELGSVLIAQGRDRGAVSIYTQAASAHPDNTVAWEGLIGAYAHMRDYPGAMTALRSMSRASFDAAKNRSGFLSAAAAAYAALGFCAEAERLLTRAIDLDRASGRRPAQGMQVQLASIWTREGRHDRAGVSYRDLLAADKFSTTAWSGYIAALHNARQDYSALAEAQRMPDAVRTTLTADAGFLSLLGSIHAAVGNNAQAVEILEQARAAFRAAGQPSPGDLDIQLAWSMVASPKYASEAPALVAAARARTDLSKEQRDALDDVVSTAIVRSAEAAMRANDPARAVAVLTGVGRELSANARIRSALASVYLQQREFDKALDLYRSSGMTSGGAADYRAAASVALAAHKNVVAEKFLWEGRQRWPDDPDLLHMTALQALSREDYASTERYLVAALAAARRGEATGSSGTPGRPLSTVTARAPLAGDLPAPGTLGEMSCKPDVADTVSGRTTPGLSAATTTGPASSPRDPAQVSADRLQHELDVVRSRNAPALGFASPIAARLGDPGLNRLIVRDSIASGSVAITNVVRVGLDAHYLDLSSGTPDGRSGYRFGSLPRGATFAGQGVRGLAGDLQVSGNQFGAVVGLSPKEFPVQNWTGGVRIGSPDGPLRVVVARDAVKDSLLSYAGARDPGTGVVWGGVVADSATLQFSHDGSGGGQYGQLGASVLRGTNVADNWSMQGTAGAYWRVARTRHGGLSVGASATAMHYDRNLNFFSLGHGGYFSPQRYLLGAVPLSWYERYDRIEYEIAASGGVQRIEQDGALIDPRQEASEEPPYEPDSRRGANYNVSFRLTYRLAPHLYFETVAGGNNARDFASRTFEIRLKCFLRQVPAGERLPVRAIPDWKGVRPVDFD